MLNDYKSCYSSCSKSCADRCLISNYLKLVDSLHNYAHRFSLSQKADIEDALSNTALYLWENDRFVYYSEAHTRGYIYRTFTNACLDYIKDRNRRERPISGLNSSVEFLSELSSDFFERPFRIEVNDRHFNRPDFIQNLTRRIGMQSITFHREIWQGGLRLSFEKTKATYEDCIYQVRRKIENDSDFLTGLYLHLDMTIPEFKVDYDVILESISDKVYLEVVH